MIREYCQGLLIAIRSVNNVVRALVNDEHHLETLRLLRWSIVSWHLFNIALILPFSEEFYGLSAYVVQRSFDPEHWYDWIVECIRHPLIRPYYNYLQCIQVGAFALALLGIQIRLSLLIAYVASENLQALSSGTLDGGDNLVSLLTVYLIFANSTGRPVTICWAPIREWVVGLSNISFYLIRVQIAVVYAASGLYKIQGDLWQSGMAIYYILQSDYSHPWLRSWVVAVPLLPMLASYMTVVFQLAFPFLVWFRRTRAGILFCGVLFHIAIAFGMGLLEFGAAMCCSYTAFFFESWSQRISKGLGSFNLHGAGQT